MVDHPLLVRGPGFLRPDFLPAVLRRTDQEFSPGANGGPGRGKTGAAALRDAIGDRSEHLTHPPVTTAAEAQALADAAFDQRARGFVRVEGTTDGNPALRVGTHLNLTGLGTRFDNTYYVYRACHRFDRVNGYETDFEAECAFVGTS